MTEHASNQAPVFLISGCPGAGKSSVAGALMRRFSFGLHIPVDDLREWVASGIAHPVPIWTNETTRQFRLARESAASTATRYAAAGFAVAIDDVIDRDAMQTYEPFFRDIQPIRVLLAPPADVALCRSATRTSKSFDAGILVEVIKKLSTMLRDQLDDDPNWLVLDNSAITVEQTVDRILSAAGRS
jgi:adenylate kinase family enzyme